MNGLKKAYCRVFQFAFRTAMPFLPYREPVKYDSIKYLMQLLKKQEVHSLLLVTDKTLREAGVTAGLEEMLAKRNIHCAVFDETCPNPTVENVEAARALYVEDGCQCIIAFGGGSCMDCAKAVGARIAYPRKSVYKMKGLLKVLLFAIRNYRCNRYLTSGTGCSRDSDQ